MTTLKGRHLAQSKTIEDSLFGVAPGRPRIENWYEQEHPEGPILFALCEKGFRVEIEARRITASGPTRGYIVKVFPEYPGDGRPAFTASLSLKWAILDAAALAVGGGGFAIPPAEKLG